LDFSKSSGFAEKSGGERAALQTLREIGCMRQSRQRLECGVFSAALMRRAMQFNVKDSLFAI
jgi:hypothetical protein